MPHLIDKAVELEIMSLMKKKQIEIKALALGVMNKHRTFDNKTNHTTPYTYMTFNRKSSNKHCLKSKAEKKIRPISTVVKRPLLINIIVDNAATAL